VYVQGVKLDNAFTKGLAFLPLRALKPHEYTQAHTVNSFLEQLRAEGVLRRSIAIDYETLTVLDGHHRLRALKLLGGRLAPCTLFDYRSELIEVWSFPGRPKVSKEDVIRAASTGRLLPPKTSRHMVKVGGVRGERSARRLEVTTLRVAESVLDLIGSTPMVRISRLVSPGDAEIYAKLEWYNPGGSVKDRMAKYLVEYAEAAGKLTKDKVILEATSGNTGIALAMIAAVKGYRCTIIMPESVSVERRKIIGAFGAELILTPGHLGTAGPLSLRGSY